MDEKVVPATQAEQTAPASQPSPTQEVVSKTVLHTFPFLKGVLLGIVLIALLGAGVGGYYLGIHKSISRPTPVGKITSTTSTPTIHPSPTSTSSAYVPSQPQVNCSTDADCMLFDTRRTTAMAMGCGGGQCVSLYDDHIIGVNRQWYEDEYAKARGAIAACPMIIMKCDVTVTDSWSAVKAACVKSVCTKVSK